MRDFPAIILIALIVVVGLCWFVFRFYPGKSLSNMAVPEEIQSIVQQLDDSFMVVSDFRIEGLGEKCVEQSGDLVPFLKQRLNSNDRSFAGKAGVVLLLLGDEMGNEGVRHALESTDWGDLVGIFGSLEALSLPKNDFIGINEFRPHVPPIDWSKICEPMEPLIHSDDLFRAKVAVGVFRFVRDPDVAEWMANQLPELPPQLLDLAVLPLLESNYEATALDSLSSLITAENFSREPEDLEEMTRGDDDIEPMQVGDSLGGFLKSKNLKVAEKARNLLGELLTLLCEVSLQIPLDREREAESGMSVHAHYMNELDNACFTGLLSLFDAGKYDGAEILEVFAKTKDLHAARPYACSFAFEINREISEVWKKELVADSDLRCSLADYHIGRLMKKGLDPLPLCDVLVKSLPDSPSQEELVSITKAFVSLGEIKEGFASQVQVMDPQLSTSVYWLRNQIDTHKALKIIQNSGVVKNLPSDRAAALTERVWPEGGALFWCYDAFAAADVLLYLDIEGLTKGESSNRYIVADHEPLIDGMAAISKGFVEAGSLETPNPVGKSVPIKYVAGAEKVDCEVEANGDWMDLDPILTSANLQLQKQGRVERFFTLTPDGQCAAIVFAPADSFVGLSKELGLMIEVY